MRTLFSVVIVLFRRSVRGGNSRRTGPWACALPLETFWVLTPTGPLSWVPESFRQDIGKISTQKVFIIIIIIIIIIIKNIFIHEKFDLFCKTVETGVGPRLIIRHDYPHLQLCVYF